MKPIWLWLALLLSVGVNLGVLATISTHRLREPATRDGRPREDRPPVGRAADRLGLEGEERDETTSRLSADQFDTLWDQIDSSGWRHVAENCNNPNAKDGDPAYIIEVGDHALTVTLSCDGMTLPFPYDSIVNELDLKAAGISGPN